MINVSEKFRSTTAWPETVPIVEPGEIDGGTLTVLHKCYEVFGGQIGYQVMSLLAGRVEYVLAYYEPDKELKQRGFADLWNTMMRDLGYVVPCKR